MLFALHSHTSSSYFVTYVSVDSLEFAGKVEANILEVVLRHLENITRIGEEDVAPLTVFSHVLVLALFEVFELGGIVAFDPAGLVEGDGFPTTLGIVFVLQSVLDDFKLELAYGANDFTPVKLVNKELGYAFVHELLNTLLELLGLHRVGILDVLKHFGREGGESAVMEEFALGEGVANLEGSVVGKADDVARPCLVYGSLALGHKLGG